MQHRAALHTTNTRASYCLAFAYDDIVKTMAVPIAEVMAHAFRGSLIGKKKWAGCAR